MTINIIVIAFDIARIHRGRIRGSIAQILIQFILMQQGAVEGVLIDIGLSGTKVFRLLTTNRHKLSRQDAYGVGGNSVGKPVAKTFPAVSLDVGMPCSVQRSCTSFRGSLCEAVTTAGSD